jgi:hypothetical protein
MTGTSGPSLETSSKSAALQQSLESRLRARTGVNGSPEYALTWKHWDMLSGPPICALRASARRTSDKDYSGWPTPTKGNADGSQMAKDASSTGRRPDGSKATVSLNQVAMAAGWPTPRAGDGEKNVRTLEGSIKEIARKNGPQDTVQAAQMAGWPTPTSQDEVRGVRPPRPHDTGVPLGQRVGQALAGISASTESTAGYRLNPEFSRWLMGYPANWSLHAPKGKPSNRR